MLKNNINIQHITAVLAEEEELRKQGYRKIYVKFEEEAEKDIGFLTIISVFIELIFSLISMTIFTILAIITMGFILFCIWSIWTI